MAKHRVLVVDDSPAAGRALTQLLADEGYEVCHVESGLEAVVIARRWAPDVAVVELGLPDLDGFAVMRELHRLPTRCQVILATGRVELRQQSTGGFRLADFRAAAERAGASAYLHKPIDLDALLHSIAECLGSSQACTA